jgi:hypothetical protein
MRWIRRPVVAGVLLFISASCATTSTPADPTSAVQGTVSASSFTVAPTGVDAIEAPGACVEASG